MSQLQLADFGHLIIFLQLQLSGQVMNYYS